MSTGFVIVGSGEPGVIVCWFDGEIERDRIRGPAARVKLSDGIPQRAGGGGSGIGVGVTVHDVGREQHAVFEQFQPWQRTGFVLEQTTAGPGLRRRARRESRRPFDPKICRSVIPRALAMMLTW